MIEDQSPPSRTVGRGVEHLGTLEPRRKPGVKRLKGGKPRRFPDHRRLEARPYNATYTAIIERYPPKDRLACRLAGLAADFLLEYERLAQSKRRTARSGSARRKTAGLLLGALRAAAGGANGQDHAPDVAAALAAMREDGS